MSTGKKNVSVGNSARHQPYNLAEHHCSFNLARNGNVTPAISPTSLEEVAEVLRDKFRRTEENISDAISQISRMTQLVTPSERIHIVKDDPDDNSILKCAQAAGSQLIVSGDKHLLNLKHFNQIPILKLSDFL